MKLSKLRKLQIKLAFHQKYASHGGIMSEIIIQELNKLIQQEKQLIKNYVKNNTRKG